VHYVRLGEQKGLLNQSPDNLGAVNRGGTQVRCPKRIDEFRRVDDQRSGVGGVRYSTPKELTFTPPTLNNFPEER
jgi:hypothetical protein